MSLLEIKNIHIKLGEFFLNNVSFSIEKGDYLNIIGPTGSGKTILLESIIGFWPPDKGQILVEGKDLTYEWPERRNIGIVYQDYALFPHFTVFDNIAYGLKKYQKSGIKNAVQQISSSLHIEHLLQRKPNTLSGGEQQRVALARALVVNPRLLLMDEPFSALDVQTRKEARLLLKQAIQNRNITVIHITHDLEDAWALANKVAVLRKGRLIQFGKLKDVFYQPECQFVADFVGTNIINCRVEGEMSDSSIVRVNGTTFTCQGTARQGDMVKVAIRPENIVVLKKVPSQETRPHFLKTTLIEIINEGNTYLLHLLSQDMIIKVLITQNAIEIADIKLGDCLYAKIGRNNARIACNANS